MCRTRCRLGPLSIFPLPHPSLRRPPAPTRLPGPPVSQMCVKDHPRAPRSPPRPILHGLGSVHALVPALWIDDATVSLFQGTLPASFRILWRPPHFEAPGRERANMGFLLRGRSCDRGTPLENKFGPGGERKYNSIARGGGERASQRGVETAPVPA